MPSLVLVLLAVLCIAAGQILFKLTAIRIRGLSIASVLVDWRTITIFGTALGIYAAATLLWVLALRDLSLSYSYMFMSLSFVIVPIAAVVLFGEQLSPAYLVGSAFIICGLVIIFGLGQ
jgi:drug/metabolite transporter (DMT)-like permease